MPRVAEEFERHALECREMAGQAYDPAYKAALMWLAENLQTRGDWLEQGKWFTSGTPCWNRTHPPDVLPAWTRP